MRNAGCLREGARVYLFVTRVSVVIRAVAITVIVMGALLITAVIVLTRPPVPRMRGIEAFGLTAWNEPIGNFGVLVAIVVTAVCLLVRRNATAWLAVFLPFIVSVMTTILYLPLLGAIDRRVDRISGPFDEPLPAGPALAAMIAATLALAMVLIALTRGRQRTALAVPMILCTILVGLHFLFLLLPMMSIWFPTDWQRRDRLVSAFDCARRRHLVALRRSAERRRAGVGDLRGRPVAPGVSLARSRGRGAVQDARRRSGRPALRFTSAPRSRRSRRLASPRRTR